MPSVLPCVPLPAKVETIVAVGGTITCKVLLSPAQIVLGVALTLVIVGKGFTCTVIVVVQPPPEGVKVYNPAFDVTDHELIAGIVTEYGVARAPYTESLKEIMERKAQRG